MINTKSHDRQTKEPYHQNHHRRTLRRLYGFMLSATESNGTPLRSDHWPEYLGILRVSQQ